MAYFRQMDEALAKLTALMAKDQKWLVLINADPDAMASAMALKRILGRKVDKVGIAHINEMTRPDNLAMVKYCRVPTKRFEESMLEEYDRFAIVDSQPGHNPAFAGIEFSVVLDHHPVSQDNPPKGKYVEIRQEYGANSTMLTEYLYNLKIKPAQLLATALLYGIKSDTQSFEREFCDVDVRAFRYLTKFSNQLVLKKIVRSEYHLSWLKYFSYAFDKMEVFGQGIFTYMHQIADPDILVILADFFLRVHEISWTAIAGIYDKTLIVIFRGDGIRRDMGQLASELFGKIGSAGGHRSAARAEIPLEKLGGADPENFLCGKLDKRPVKFCQNNFD